MLVDYFHWQYVMAPRWLLLVAWNVQRAIVQLFSVKLMLRTLIAPWHRDTLAFHGGTLSELGMVMLWNVISRGIGLLFRVGVLTLWLIVEALYLAFIIVAGIGFLAWPWLVLIGFATGLALFLV
jgi:hypothetical protein